MSKYPGTNIIKSNTLREFLDLELTKLLPNQDIMIKNHLNLVKYIEMDTSLLVLRKFKNHSYRGSLFSYENCSFTVSDNEPALWVFMNTYYLFELDFKDLIENKSFPIAFALRKEERQKNEWGIIGRKHHSFSKNGWKHCHIFQCSPNGELITHKNDLKRRCLRLLSPLNHFPFFSPRKYDMPIDYGENNQCIEYVIWWLYNHFYNETNKFIFKAFVEGQGFSIAIKEPKDIIIDYKLKDFNQPKTKKNDKFIVNTKDVKKESSIKSKINTILEQRESKCFKISKDWYGNSLIIIVNFPNGRMYQYNHDYVYENTISHYGKLPCWEKYSCFSNSINIPKIALPFVNEI